MRVNLPAVQNMFRPQMRNPMQRTMGQVRQGRDIRFQPGFQLVQETGAGIQIEARKAHIVGQLVKRRSGKSGGRGLCPSTPQFFEKN